MRISKRQLKRIIREEAESHWGGDDHDYKRVDGHRAGEVDGHYKDYEGPEGGNQGDESKTHPGHVDYDDAHHKAKVAVAAIQDLASAAGVDLTPGDEAEAAAAGVEELALESTRRRNLKRIIRKSVREARRRLNEDEIDTELDNLHKNISDDIEHIKDLRDDLEDDREEEHRAELEKERKDENLKRRLRRKVRVIKRRS